MDNNVSWTRACRIFDRTFDLPSGIPLDESPRLVCSEVRNQEFVAVWIDFVRVRGFLTVRVWACSTELNVRALRPLRAMVLERHWAKRVWNIEDGASHVLNPALEELNRVEIRIYTRFR